MSEIINSEVTGSVWKIQCKVGDIVQPDDTIMILESMKMEIPVLSEDEGTIKKLLVSEGESIKEGQALVILE